MVRVRSTTIRSATVLLAAVCGLGVPAGAAQAAQGDPGGPHFTAGSTQGGDPYFPQAGNGGYDVGHYELDLRYAQGGRLDGTAVLTLTATMDLSSFSLDLRGLTATSVAVDGTPARFRQLPPPASGRGGELVVRPASGLRAGTTHRVAVVYGGSPGQPTDIEGALYGFVTFPDGALVANEPEGAATWYPVNDLLTDKATYDFRITVPAGKVAVANGELVDRPTTSGGRTTFHWRATDPMASYLSTASIGDYQMTQQAGPGNLPIYDFVDRNLDPKDRATTRDSLAQEPAMIAFFQRLYGGYPFTSAGAIVDDDSVGYALETQTRPVCSGAPDEATVAHELAHQWLGDSVTPRTWQDIWLNEGFATYSEWLWAASRSGPTLQQRFDDVYSTPADDELWTTAPGDPGPRSLFAAATYDRGAAALYALQEKIGQATFATLLHRWTTENAGRNVSTADFMALAEQVSGRQLDSFFQIWIDRTSKPIVW